LPHDVKVKLDIMVGGKNGRCEFSGGEEMPKISAGIAATDTTFALRVDGILVFGIATILNEDAPCEV